MLINNESDRAILVVDDSKTVRTTVSKLLANENFRIITAIDGIDALEKLKEHAQEIYVILLDIMMPRLDGYTVLNYISRVHPLPISVSAMTSKDDLTSQIVFFSQNTSSNSMVLVSRYITKPFAKTELVDLINNEMPVVHEKRVKLAARDSSISEVLKRLDTAYSDIQSLDGKNIQISDKIDQLLSDVSYFSEKTQQNSLSVNDAFDKQLCSIEQKQEVVSYTVSNINNKIDDYIRTYRSNEKIRSSLLYSLGFELVKIIIISLFIAAIIGAGMQDLVKELFKW